jgi:glycine hydroxymethyltransferase
MSVKNLNDLLETVKLHENWRTHECLNLAAAENISSNAARQLLQTDLGNRYTNPKGSNFHRGTKFLDEIQRLAEDFAKQTFNAKFADVRPISGHLADMAVVMALTRRGDKVLSLSAKDGGYPGTSQAGLGKFLGLGDVFFPFDKRRMNIDVEEAKLLVEREKPRLIIFGASYILFPQPVREICAVSQDAVHVYDGSHVLGLIAGGEFQDPLRDGCSLLFGSTHKSFPGPQGGIIVSDNPTIFEKVADSMMPGIIDNIHLHRIAALAVSLLEMKEFGKAYAKAVVENARALARSLHALGV